MCTAMKKDLTMFIFCFDTFAISLLLNAKFYVITKNFFGVSISFIKLIQTLIFYSGQLLFEFFFKHRTYNETLFIFDLRLP